MKQFLGVIAISSNASLTLFVLALSYPVVAITQLAVAGLAHNLRLSVPTAEWLWDYDVLQIIAVR